MVFSVSIVTMAGFFDWFTDGSDFKYYSSKKLHQSIEQEKEFLLVDEKLATISTEKLATQLGTEDLVVVDVRSDAAYNGWKLKGETRGGHIKGAVHFPVSWLELLENEELIDTLKKKGVTSDKKIVVYGYKDSQSKKLGLFLKDELDYKDVAIYKNGIVKWSANNDLPMDKLPNYSKLVSPKWVKDLIDGKDPATYDGRDFVIIDTNYKKFGHYKKGHIPTSIYVDTNEIEEPPLWNIVSDAKLKELFKKTGITKDTLVVVYSEEPMAAGRLISVLMYAGVEDVRMLDGGYQTWERAGYSLEKGVNEWQVGGYQVWKKTGYSLKKEIKEWQTGADFRARIPVHPEYYINVAQAKELLKDPNGRLVAVVSWDEYIGENNGGYSYFDEKGRIPGSVWGHGGSDAYHSEHFVDSDWTMRSYPEIEKMWADWDINPNNESSFFCATGWRGGLAMFDAYLMGWENISVFDGGWYEWSRNPKNSVEFGDPRKE